MTDTMPPTSKPHNRVVGKEKLELILSIPSSTMWGIVKLDFETAMRRGGIALFPSPQGP